MSAVMGDMDNVGKTGVNREQGYKFRSIEDVLTAAHTALVKHGVFFLPKVLDRIPEERETKGNRPMNVIHLEIEYTFYAADGSSVSSVVWGEGSDMADKSTNKAMSQALKYNLVQALCISAGDMPDSDASAEEAGPRRPQSAGAAFDNARPAPPRNQQQSRPPVTVPPLDDGDSWKDKIDGVADADEGKQVRQEINELLERGEIDQRRANRLHAALTAKAMTLATNGPGANGHSANGHAANGQAADGHAPAGEPAGQDEQADQRDAAPSRSASGNNEQWVADFLTRLASETSVEEINKMQREVGRAVVENPRKITAPKAAELSNAIRDRRHALQQEASA